MHGSVDFGLRAEVEHYREAADGKAEAGTLLMGGQLKPVEGNVQLAIQNAGAGALSTPRYAPPPRSDRAMANDTQTYTVTCHDGDEANGVAHILSMLLTQNGNPAVAVHATVAQILGVSQLTMRAGGLLPVGFFTERGMKVLGQILSHKLVVKGLLTHTVASLRTIALLSVAE